MHNHVTELLTQFKDHYGQQPLLVRSPGRVNIIGEHTDYNDGFVLPAAIDKAAYLAISLREDNQIHVVANDLNENFTIDWREMRPVRESGWPNYLLGPVAQFIKAGYNVSGFNAMLSSNIPIGAGLSSSAAVECAVAFALNELLKTNIDKIILAKMAQMAEHEYAGVKCGIMDQFASLLGKKSSVIKLDCRSLDFEYIPFELSHIKVVLLNTNVKHSLASSEYNTRRRECSQATSWVREHHPSVKSLRDVSDEMLLKHVLPKDKTTYKRASFVVHEIQRLLNACHDLEKGDLKQLGKRMFETHKGLSEDYEVSCKELDFLVVQAQSHEGVLGARMMGGGFGGCTINLVYENQVDAFIEDTRKKYEAEMQLPLHGYVASIESGTALIEV